MAFIQTKRFYESKDSNRPRFGFGDMHRHLRKHVLLLTVILVSIYLSRLKISFNLITGEYVLYYMKSFAFFCHLDDPL